MTLQQVMPDRKTERLLRMFSLHADGHSNQDNQGEATIITMLIARKMRCRQISVDGAILCNIRQEVRSGGANDK